MINQQHFFPGVGRQNVKSTDIELMADAMAGNMVFKCYPATVSTAATSAARTRKVRIQLENSSGAVHTWFSKAITSGVSIADTSTAGTATIASTTLTFINGIANVTVSCNAAAWLATETNTLTVAQATIMGTTVAQKTSVETFA